MSRRILRRILEDAGHEVVEADEGAAGLELFFLERPAMVFLDLTMKGMYGLDVLAKIRQVDPDALVVIASADIQDQTRELVKQAGASGFVNKPLTPDKVLSAVRTVMGESGPA